MNRDHRGNDQRCECIVFFFDDDGDDASGDEFYLSIGYCEHSNLYTGLCLELSFTKSDGVHNSYTFQCAQVGSFTSPGIGTR